MQQKPYVDYNFISRLFYFGMHILSLMTLAIYDNPLRRKIIIKEYEDPLCFLIILGVSNFLFLTVGQNAGSKTQPRLENDQVSIEFTDFQQIPTENEESKQSILSVEETASEQDVQENNKKIEANTQPFCDFCQKVIPYRTRHCKRCKKCIPKFDHHCHWLGGCIGELNHRWFYFFLIVQSFVQINCIIWKFWDAMGYNPYVTKINGKLIYSQEYGAFCVLAVVMFVLTLFSVALLFYHTYLILIGVTTWEQNKHYQISYLKMYPSNFNPFDEGLIGNIKSTFFHGNKLKQWTPKPVPNKRNEDQKSFNYFRNQYYSCC